MYSGTEVLEKYQQYERELKAGETTSDIFLMLESERGNNFFGTSFLFAFNDKAKNLLTNAFLSKKHFIGTIDDSKNIPASSYSGEEKVATYFKKVLDEHVKKQKDYKTPPVEKIAEMLELQLGLNNVNRP